MTGGSPGIDRNRLIAAIGHTKWTQDLDTREKAAGLCLRAALWTMSALEEAETPAELVCLTEGDDFHYVVKVQDLAIDLTSRQFPAGTEYPRVCAFEEIRREWANDPDIVNLEDSNTRYAHEIPENWREIASADPPGGIAGWPYGYEWPNAPLTEDEMKRWKEGRGADVRREDGV